jgi:hypothetical protein
MKFLDVYCLDLYASVSSTKQINYLPINSLIGNITLNQTLHRNHNNTGETENQKEIIKNVLLFI